MTSLSLTQQQKLQTKLSPAQIQVIRMLEIPAVELQQRVTEELQQNPVLEEGPDPEAVSVDSAEYEHEDEDFDFDAEDRYRESEEYKQDYGASDDTYEPIVSYSGSGRQADEDSGSREVPYGGEGLIDHLKSQVYLTKMTKPQRHIAKWVLGNIDNDGYLRRSIEQLVDDISFQEGIAVTDEEMADIVSQIKQFDPAGIASSTLQECLLTQLRHKAPTPAVQTAIRMLDSYYDAFTRHHYDRLCQRLNISDEMLKEAISEITHLNQKPANAFRDNMYDTQQSTIIPDFQIINTDQGLKTILNTGDIPDLHVSVEYKQMLTDLSGTRDQEAARFIRNNINSARWFIDAIQQRNRTLYATMEAIKDLQQEFFIEGDNTCLKPLILQDIADKTGFDVSTISRVCNNKYVQTEYGIFPLKFFFSESLNNLEGNEVTTTEVRTILRELIDEEDKREPYNDDQLVDMLRDLGYVVARRTVTKYREMLNIPVARMRKQV